LVVMRKITFGNRSEAGAKRLAVLMTVAETSRRHGSKASDIYFGLFTRPPSQVMQDIYAGR
jgi:transposase